VSAATADETVVRIPSVPPAAGADAAAASYVFMAAPGAGGASSNTSALTQAIASYGQPPAVGGSAGTAPPGAQPSGNGAETSTADAAGSQLRSSVHQLSAQLRQFQATSGLSGASVELGPDQWLRQQHGQGILAAK